VNPRTVPPHKDPDVIERGTAALAELREACRSLVFASLITEDGFEIVRTPTADGEDGRLASMTSSVQALADAVSRELHLGESEFVIIASEAGHVIQRRVPGQPIVFAGVFDTDETLGKALSISRLTTERLAVGQTV
jgi:predicted regulator of Ras-like GTPase activity (Roadblock/LC7/MglB family)